MATTFKKSTFEIETHREGRKPRSGYVAGPFGIAKEKEGWIATHLPSGLRISVLTRPTLSETKAAVATALETYKGWDATTIEAICGANSIEPRALRTALYLIGRSA